MRGTKSLQSSDKIERFTDIIANHARMEPYVKEKTCKTLRCQCYVGMGRRGKSLRRLEAETAALMVTYGESIAKAMMAVGYSRSTAYSHTRRLTQNHLYIEAMNKIRKTMTQTNEGIFDKIANRAGMNITKMVSVGKQKESKCSLKVPDHLAMERWAEIIGNIQRIFEEEKNWTGNNVVNIQIVAKKLVDFWLRSNRGVN